MPPLQDGFWLPANIKSQLITDHTKWIEQYYAAARPADSDTPGAVGAHWPVFTRDQWTHLLTLLDGQRTAPPKDFLPRLAAGFKTLSARFNDPNDPLTQTALTTIPAYTGYAPEMIQFVLGSLDLMPLNILSALTGLTFPPSVQSTFTPFPQPDLLPGRVRFFPEKRANPLRGLFSNANKKPLYHSPDHPDLVLGYAAGNVIGTAQLITLLAQFSALVSNHGAAAFPSVLVKNSRQEPIFAPLIFTALEQIDPLLTSTLALMIWDYEDTDLQEYLVAQSDLVIAAAADFTIDQLNAVIQRVATPDHPIRFHAHGHKVSFTTIGKDYLKKDHPIQEINDLDLTHLTTFLAAIDSIFWDQYGCLSSRVHFVEQGDTGTISPQEYGQLLAEKIRLLSNFIPRGAIPLHGVHNRYEKYAAMTISGQVQLCSTYEDDFLVVVDARPWTPSIFQNVVNDCIERTIIIRPITTLQEVPDRYLGWLPAHNLQTMSVAIDSPAHSTWSTEFSQFVDAISVRGVTGIRTIGRGPFPQMAYSWDGLLPLDLSRIRPPGRFTTVEFENTFQEIINTYQLYAFRMGQLQ